MNSRTETIDQSAFSRQQGGADKPKPGLVLVYSAGEPMRGVFVLDQEELVLGRGQLKDVEIADRAMSRKHASVAFQKGEWIVTDHGSRNGTAVDGQKVTGQTRGENLKVVRTGESLFLLCKNVNPYVSAAVDARASYVLGPQMRPVMEQIRQAARSGILHITGETGAGKEIAARTFHETSGQGDGPFVAVNCAAIPDGLAEKLFFGAKKGAYSGATEDSAGYLVQAHGGTLFLDEVGELDANIQAKLLRVLETKEVVPLGDSRSRKVDIQICSATHADLRACVGRRTFREDLYYRMGRPVVSLPPLRTRLDDIPPLIERELRHLDKALVAHVSLVEACLLRPWPGNIRELLFSIKETGAMCLAQNSKTVRASHLPEDAGLALLPGAIGSPTDGRPRVDALPDRKSIVAALINTEGKVATAARDLGLHRTQLRRLLEKYNIDPKTPQ